MLTRNILRPIVILGPTAGGKSHLAIGLAQAIGGQIIGADSMQVYRHMNAGTAKPPHVWRQRVKHHLIDIVEPTQRFTVADWLKKADTLIQQIKDAQQWPIIVGGTNLYIKALLAGLFDGPGSDPHLREQLTAKPSQTLHKCLEAVDLPTARRIHPNDHKKLVRALEVYYLTGKPISLFQKQWDQHPPLHHDDKQDLKVTAPSHLAETATASPRYRHDPILIGLEWPTEVINRRINHRVKAMFFPNKVISPDADQSLEEHTSDRESLPTEVRRLYTQDLLGPQAREALGYKQVIEHLNKHYSLDEAYEKTKILTRRFAKSQRTWLRRFRPVKWLWAYQRHPQSLIDEAESIIRN